MRRTGGTTYFVSVLGFKRGIDTQWSAVALDMDLWGFGATFEKALADLEVHVRMQIDFARFKNQPELVWKQTESVYFDLYSRARAEALKQLAGKPRPTSQEEYRAAALPMTSASQQHFSAGMGKALKFRELRRKLLKYDKRFEFLANRGKGSERMIYHPDIGGVAASSATV